MSDSKYENLTAKEHKLELQHEAQLAKELSKDGNIVATSHAFLNNIKLKKAGVQLRFTYDQALEYAKCKNDPVYFIEKYIKIVHVDDGLIPFKLYPYQRDMVKQLYKERFNIFLACRQSGKSVTTVGGLLHYILFNVHKNVAIIANKGMTAREILSRLQLAYENLPIWIQSGIIAWNKGSIELENGCKVLASATSGSAIRGYSIAFLFVDEVAFIPENIWNEFYKSVYPTIASGRTTKIVLVSTVNKMNHFHKLVMNARRGIGSYKLKEITWRDVPRYDEEWKVETIGNTDEDTFRQEFENEFLGGSGTLLCYSSLRQMQENIQYPISKNGGMSIYKKPEKNHIYVLVADVSEGVMRDYSTFSIIDITSIPYIQVATFRRNDVSTLVFPSIIFTTAMSYNMAYVIIENNSMGGAVIQRLNYDLEYENLLAVRSQSSKHTKLGINTNARTKIIGCNRLKEQIESDSLIVYDEITSDEFFSFIEHKTSFAAEVGKTDDMVMTLVMFAFFSTTPMFNDISNVDFSKKFLEIRATELEDNLCPLPVIDNGIEHNEPNQINTNFIDNETDIYTCDDYGDEDLSGF